MSTRWQHLLDEYRQHQVILRDAVKESKRQWDDPVRDQLLKQHIVPLLEESNRSWRGLEQHLQQIEQIRRQCP